MNLNGREIVQRGIITNVTNDDCIQQVGVDLELIAVDRVFGVGIIPKIGKTKLGKRERVEPYTEVDGTQSWNLEPGVYDITLAQGCNIPADQRLRIVQRSSLLRNGVFLASSMFDPGFKTDNIGTIFLVTVPVTIEVGARVGQAYVTNVNAVNDRDLYSGQWQMDQQRTFVINNPTYKYDAD